MALIKTIAGAIIVCTGAFIGVYIGWSFIKSPNIQVNAKSANERIPYPEDIQLTFEIGKKLPNLNFTDSLNNSITSKDFLHDKRCIILLVSIVCTDCPLFLQEWHENVMPHIDSDVKVLIAFPDDQQFFTEQETQLLDGMDLLRFEQTIFERKYNLTGYPVIVCLNSDETVFDIEYGYSQFYHEEILEEYTSLEFN